MLDFILNMILWTLAIYGLIEIVKNVYCVLLCTNLRSNGVYLIIACKNQEKNIEAYIRSIFFRLIYGKEEYIKDVIVSDLDSKDKTLDILQKLQKEYKELKIIDWKTCKEMIDIINDCKK